MDPQLHQRKSAQSAREKSRAYPRKFVPIWFLLVLIQNPGNGMPNYWNKLNKNHG